MQKNIPKLVNFTKMFCRVQLNGSRFLVYSRLATSRLAYIFGRGRIYKHDKKLKRAETPEINPAPEASELRSAEGAPEPEGLCENLGLLQYGKYGMSPVWSGAE